MTTDTGDPISVREAAKQVGAALNDRGLNLVINNAGINVGSTLEASSPQHMIDTYKINVVGPMLVSKEFLLYLRRAAQTCSQEGLSCSRAAVINISTLMDSIRKCPENFARMSMYPYRCSKAALNMLTCCLAEDIRAEGILCVAIHPGWVKTDMGGGDAPLEPVDSVRGLLHVISSLRDESCGQFLDWEGNRIPW
ncbi:C-signal [Amia ocellicauda]|uniref:C-signal n=1 Tax=Amia ocellicauda TaxID=2972642 RepID=UPI003463CD53